MKKVRLITRPNGIGNLAHDLWVKNYKGTEARKGNEEESLLSSLPSVECGAVWSCHFVDIHKLEVFSKLRMAFENRAVRVPVSRVIREDLHSVSRVASLTGQLTYRAPYHADGHADRCTALALAWRAAGEGGRGSGRAPRLKAERLDPWTKRRVVMEERRFFGAKCTDGDGKESKGWPP